MDEHLKSEIIQMIELDESLLEWIEQFESPQLDWCNRENDWNEIAEGLADLLEQHGSKDELEDLHKILIEYEEARVMLSEVHGKLEKI